MFRCISDGVYITEFAKETGQTHESDTSTHVRDAYRYHAFVSTQPFTYMRMQQTQRHIHEQESDHMLQRIRFFEIIIN